jgi:ParB/RepB/Spo0J family partition protein
MTKANKAAAIAAAPTPAPKAKALPAIKLVETPAADAGEIQRSGQAIVPWQLIVPDLLNPRKEFDQAVIEELADSIAEHGLMQNLVVRPLTALEGYGQPMHRLVAGERRWRAIGLLIKRGHFKDDHQVAVQIRDLTDEQHAVLALIENMQRKDLNPLEEADAFKRLTDEFGLKPSAIAKGINCTPRLVQQRLQLLQLTPDDRKLMAEGKLNVEQARQRVANYPKPFDFSPAEKLLLLEVMHHVATGSRRQGVGLWNGPLRLSNRRARPPRRSADRT